MQQPAYPAMKKFVTNGWVKRRSKPESGQTRACYALTSGGRRELFRGLREFEKESASASEFRLRVGLFEI
jgi:DNA-binding PadR family transcriptional regulator